MIDHSEYNWYITRVVPHEEVSDEELAVLWQRAQDGDVEARKQFVNANLMWVARAVHHAYGNTGKEMWLISRANLKLLALVDTYKPQLGKFRTYAQPVILKDAASYLPRVVASVTGKGNAFKRSHRLRKYYQQLLQSGCNQTQAMLQSAQWFCQEELHKSYDEQCDTERERIYRYAFSLIHLTDTSVSLDAAIGDDTDSITLVETMGDDSFSPEDGAMLSADINLLKEAIRRLSAQQRYVLVHCYGLFGFTEMSVIEIAEAMNVSRQRVYAIKKSAEDKLKEWLSNTREEEID